MARKSDSPAVEAVRKARRELLRQCGFDMHRYAEFLREKEKISKLRFGAPRGRRAKAI
jgi:hypothetical protein